MNKVKIEKLKKYFEKQEEILMAFAFGSQAKNKCVRVSDWDIAIYLKPKKENPLSSENIKLHGLIEWEERNREYPEEDKIWGDLISLL